MQALLLSTTDRPSTAAAVAEGTPGPQNSRPPSGTQQRRGGHCRRARRRKSLLIGFAIRVLVGAGWPPSPTSDTLSSRGTTKSMEGGSRIHPNSLPAKTETFLRVAPRARVDKNQFRPGGRPSAILALFGVCRGERRSLTQNFKYWKLISMPQPTDQSCHA